MRRLALLSACLLAVSWQALGNPPPGSDGTYHEWFEKQMTPDDRPRSCCVFADGHILEDDDWRIFNGEYQVRTGPGDSWTTFPNTGQGKPHNTIMGYTANPTGKPVAWWLGVGGNAYPLCFAPGTVS